VLLMRDPNRIDEVLAEVKRVWAKHPDLRLGQLIGHAVNETFENRGGLTNGSLALRMLVIEETALLEGIGKIEHKLDRLTSRQED
jgi:uncharacterized protein YihD (DUF1040 family)